MTGTILARPDVSKATKLDVEILGGYLNLYRQAPWRIDLAFAMALMFDKAAKGHYRSHEIGGLVTWIAKRHFEIENINDYEPATKEVPYIDKSWLINHHHWVKPLPLRRWGWLVQQNRWLTLPCDALPPLESLPEAANRRDHDPPHYVIPLDLVPFEDVEAPTPARPRRREVVPSPSVTHSAPLVAPSTSDGSYDPNTFHEQRYIYQSLASQLTQYGQHTHMVDLGYIPQTGPHPPFWLGADRYPGTIFRDHGVDPSTYTGNVNARYGGIAGQYLPQFGTGSVGYPGDFGDAFGDDLGGAGASTSGGGVGGSGLQDDDDMDADG